MTPERFRCSSASRALGESQRGTASVVRSWILIERPGPWGYDALLQSRLPRRAARQLRKRARALGIRIVLIRRPGRSASPGGHCFFAYSGPRVQRLERVHLDGSPADLLDLDWSALPGGEPIGVGEEDTDPLFLVCTNGARDPCCAERGRAVARALVPVFEDRVWECSHIGGDRFAANLVCLPHGVYFGRLSPDESPSVALRYREGVIDLDHYRSRSCYDFATQAAESFVRERLGLRGVDDVRLGRRVAGPGGLEAEFAVPGGQVRATVAIRASQEARRLTCHGEANSHPPLYALLDLTKLSATIGRRPGPRDLDRGGA